MGSKVIQIRETDDWIDIRIDGKDVYGNHSIDGTSLLVLLGINYEYKYIEYDDENEWGRRWEDQ